MTRSHRLAAAFLFVAPFSTTALASDVGFPPIAATDAFCPGKPVYAQLATPSLARAERFYGSLFGWTFRDVPTSHWRYAEAMLDGHNVGSLIERPLPDVPGAHASWLVFLSAADVDAAARDTRARGGRVLYHPRDIPGFGREAVLTDPQGGVFAVLHSTSGDPADAPASNDDWIWASLHTPSPEVAAGFYGAVLGDTAYALRGDMDHFVLGSQGYARASINPLPAAARGAGAHWLRFVRVPDIEAAVAKAKELGGTVAVAPYVDHDGGKVAIVIDPDGAAFGLLEWPDDAPPDVTK